MTYRLTTWAKSREPLTGVPWRDMTDEEFAEANSQHDGLLIERGYFVYEMPEVAEIRGRSRIKGEMP